MTSLQPRHFINLPDIDPAVLKAIINQARALKAQKMSPAPIFNGLSLAMIFDKPSTRTRLSFSLAMKQHGGHSEILNKNEIQLGHSENIKDTARVISRMVDAVMLRISSHEQIEEFASHATVPVINALTDASHPCQIMADLMTIQEHKGKIEGLNIAWLGDYNNVAKTFAQAAVPFDFNLTMGMPAALLPQSVAGNIALTTDPHEAVRNADIVVTDTWASMGQEGKNLEMFWPFQVNPELMARAKPDALFMHCLPAHRNEEVTDAVMDGRQSIVYDEAENRLHVQKAILAWCLKNAGVRPKP